MADIDVSGDSGHKKGQGVKKAKKLSTRVDMTPMVDLGFLLITFFIFTATMSTPNTMKLTMPKDEKNEKDQMEVKESSALTLLLGANNHIFYYEGQLKADGSNFKSISFPDVRQVIMAKKKEVMSRHVHDEGCKKIWEKNGGDQKSCLDKDFVVVIKPNKDATYKNTVDALDEMTINNVQRFAVVDITPQEEEAMKLTEQSNKGQ